MTHLILVGEGQTEETFAARVLVPALINAGILVMPRLIPTSKHGRGGALKKDRVLGYLRNTIRERQDTYVTTFFDLYALGPDFPGVQESAGLADAVHRAAAIEKHFASAVVASAECLPKRFIAHVQPHEFESLLFSDVEKFALLESAWVGQISELGSARAAFATPEHINDGSKTHPSARLENALKSPRYRKVLHGSLIAESIGLAQIRSECKHFHDWLARIETLDVSEKAQTDSSG